MAAATESRYGRASAGTTVSRVAAVESGVCARETAGRASRLSNRAGDRRRMRLVRGGRCIVRPSSLAQGSLMPPRRCGSFSRLRSSVHPTIPPSLQESPMKRIAPWLAVALLIVNAGCKESASKSSGSSRGRPPARRARRARRVRGRAGGATGSASASAGVSATAKSDAAHPPGRKRRPPGPQVPGHGHRDRRRGNGRRTARPLHRWLTDGTKVDSSVDRGQPIEFPLGTPDLIQGWNEGIAGHEGGRQAQAHDSPAGLRGGRSRAEVRPTPRSSSISSWSA
jgi:hypothetical protein